MNKIGIICDTHYSKHIGFKNYYHALANCFGEIKIIENISDLSINTKYLFIGNEHYPKHKNIWDNNKFIEKCNDLNITVIVFSAEKIFNSYFNHNILVQKNLEKFDLLFQYPCDIEDAKILNRPLLSSCLSRYYHQKNNTNNKINEIIFIGNTNCFSYNNRINCLNNFTKLLPLKIIPQIDNWLDYFSVISQYKFILCPLGNAKCFNLRFYESLTAHSIPIQEIHTDMLPYYDIESKFDDCIFFTEPKECVDKIDKFIYKKSYNNLWLEDHIKNLLAYDNIEI